MATKKTQSKSTQRSAREQVREQQQQAAARDQRMQVVFRSLVGVAVLAIVAVVAAIALNQGGSPSATPTTVTDDGGIVLEPAAGEGAGGPEGTEGAAGADTEVGQVGVYLDFQCPHCRTFDLENQPFLTEQLQAGTIALTVHPVALMDNASQGTEFSSRAANAAVCVAEHQPEALLEVIPGLFDLQSAAAQGSVDDDVLLGAVSGAGADSSDVRACVLDREFDGWVREATDRALSDPALSNANGGFGTPTVTIDGQRLNSAYTPQTLAAALGL